jgi:type II secretion system protein D
MRAYPGFLIKTTILLTAGGMLGLWSSRGQTADPPNAIKINPLAQKLGADAPAKNNDLAISFEFRNKPWIGVMEWLRDISGLPILGINLPTGSFTFIPPKGKTYNLPEIIDVLNEGLVAQNYILIRRDQSFTLVTASDAIDPSIVPRISVAEMKDHGNTEIVSVVVTLKSLNAEDFAPVIKKTMGPFGSAVGLPSPINQLVLQDQVKTLRRVLATIEDQEKNEKGQAESFTYKCKYIKARDAAKTLRDVLGNPADIQRLQQPPTSFRDRFNPNPNDFTQGGGPNPVTIRVPQPTGGAAAQQQPTTKLRPHYVTANDATNTVMIKGPVEIIAQARAFLKDLDVGDKQIIIGNPDFKVHNVPSGMAEGLATTLRGIYKESDTLRISTSGNNKIIVYACPDDQDAILKHILGVTENGAKNELIPLVSMEASKVVELLKGAIGESKGGGPFIDAEPTRNAIIVRGTAEQVDDIKKLLEVLGESGKLTETTRIIPITQGSAANLAEAIERHFKGIRNNPIKVINPARDEKTAPKKNSSGGSEEQEEPGIKPKNKNRQLVDPQQKKDSANDTGSKEKPVKISVVGNRLIIESEDPKALQMVQDLARILTQTPSDKGDFEIIRLKNANAVELAKVLDEAMNGTRPQTNQNNPFLVGFPFPGRSSQNQATEPKVRIVADPKTNSLLVRASPVDMATIRNWLEVALDTGEAEGQKTFVVGPLKYASATEVAALVRDVYREFINNNPQQLSSFGGFSPFGRRNSFVNQNLDGSGNPRGVSLSVGVDDRSNSLVVMCSTAMHKDIETLAKNLDDAAQSSTRTVRLVSIKGVDPVLVQQAIEAIQGRTGGQRGTGAPGFVPFGTGGMIPGSTFPSSGFPSRFRNSGGFSPSGGFVVPPGGSGRSSMLSPDRGPDFFAQRVMDDPQPTELYDPQLDTSATDEATSANQNPLGSSLGFSDHDAERTPDKSGIHGVGLGFKGIEHEKLTVWAVRRNPNGKPGSLQLVRHEEQQQQQPQPPQQPPGDIRGPRSQITAEALEQLGIIIVTGNNQADVEEIVKIIETILKLAAGAEFNFELVPLQHADATSVANTLTQMFSRVQIAPSANYPVRTTGTTGAAQPPLGAAPPPTTTATTQAQSSVVLLPLPRLNAILAAAPKARMEDVKKQIKQLDIGSSPPGKAVYIQLKKASAPRVATLLSNFFASRYPETQAQNQIRISQEESTNSLIVQASPADLAEIKDLVEQIETTVSQAVNELRIVPLKNVTSDEMATLLNQIITQGIVAPSPTAAPTAPVTPGGPVTPGIPRPTTPTPPSAAGPGAATKTTSVKFYIKGMNGQKVLQSGLLEDVHISSSPRINSLIVAAPEKSMELLLNLIKALDVLPGLRADVRIFQFKNADATAMANMIQQLFLGTGTTTPTAPTTGGPTPGGPPPTTGPTPPTGGAPRTMAPIALAGVEGAPLIDLRMSVDLRTNSLIVAGSANDIFMIESIVYRLEDADVDIRRNEVYHLRNASAADVASAITSYLTSAINVYSKGGQLTPFQDVEREIVVVPEPISNKLLISATPRYFDEVMRLIKELDAEPPQVVIQCLIAEVDLNNTEEFGVEIGLQSPVLFQRGIIPADGFLSSGTISYTTPTTGTGLVPPGVTVSSTINPAAVPGFAFNNTNPLGNNPVVGPGIVGFQGLGNLGVGRASPTSGIGGFVFSAGNDTFNLLIRALTVQGRMELLSRPQLMTMDNQTASLHIGQLVPYNNSTVTATGIISNSPVYQQVGVILNVTPKISPDGKVMMRVEPNVSSVSPIPQSLGGGLTAPIFNTQDVITTVMAQDGETVAIGGLITKLDQKSENKIPWFGDLPCVGVLFRYRTQVKRKVELIVILTPHIVRSRLEGEMILAEEARKISFTLKDVLKIHGTSGLEPLMAPETNGSPDCPPGSPASPMQSPAGAAKSPAGKGEMLPPPQPPKPGGDPGPGSNINPPAGAAAGANTRLKPVQQTGNLNGQTQQAAPQNQLLPTAVNGTNISSENGTEKGKWIFLKNASEPDNPAEGSPKR